jgi:hypothetical protein
MGGVDTGIAKYRPNCIDKLDGEITWETKAYKSIITHSLAHSQS